MKIIQCYILLELQQTLYKEMHIKTYENQTIKAFGSQITITLLNNIRWNETIY